MWGFCFQPGFPPGLAFVALGPLVLVVARFGAGAGSSALRLGWLHGIAAWWVQVPWIATTIHRYGGLPRWAAILLLLLLCAYLGSYHAVFAWIARRALRAGDVLALLGLPAAWVALEWLRGFLFTGFPWNLAGYSLVDVPGALGLAPFVGAYGLSFVAVLANASWSLAWIRRRPGALAGALAAAALLATGWAASRAGDASSGSRDVALVQPGTQVITDPSSSAVLDAYARLIELSRCSEPGALVVWPESAAWPYSWQVHEHLQRDLRALASQGCFVLFNTTTWEDDQIYNSALLLGPQGALQRYDKNHLVPFGEYVPLHERLPFLQQIARAAGSYDAADDVTLLGWSGERLGLAICFEITLPEQVATRVRLGATVLVTLTNDAWFGDTSAPWQHLAAARLRAAENRRPVLRAAITGISASIDEQGRVRERLSVGEVGVIETEVAGETELTPYTRWPLAVPAASGLVTLLLVWRSSKRQEEPWSPAKPSSSSIR